MSLPTLFFPFYAITQGRRVKQGLARVQNKALFAFRMDTCRRVLTSEQAVRSDEQNPLSAQKRVCMFCSFLRLERGGTVLPACPASYERKQTSNRYQHRSGFSLNFPPVVLSVWCRELAALSLSFSVQCDAFAVQCFCGCHSTHRCARKKLISAYFDICKDPDFRKQRVTWHIQRVFSVSCNVLTCMRVSACPVTC